MRHLHGEVGRSFLKLMFTGILLGASAFITYACGRQLYRRYFPRFMRYLRNDLSRKVRNACFRMLGRDVPIDLEHIPPPAEEPIDKISMENFECIDCQNEARNIVLMPCKHCYQCENCYKRSEDKFVCARCQGQVTGIVKIYVVSWCVC